jgi:hypothetical protein
VSLIQEFDSKTLVLGRGYEFTFVRVDLEILTRIDERKEARALNNEEYDILDIENERRCPVHYVVDVALRCGANNQVIVLHAHIYDTLPKVQVIVHFM